MPRELFIPGLDDGGKSYRENEIFDLEPDSPESPIKRKDFRVPHAEGEGTITGNVSAFQTSFNMVKVFVGIGILATPASFKLIGLLGGSIGMILVGALNTYTMKL